jgi:signal transduction histidine kinase
MAALAAAEARASVLHGILSAAAHEIRTPVASLKGTAQLALRRLERGSADPEQLARALRQVDAEADRITRLLAQLLEAASMARGTATIQQGEVDLCAVTARVVAELRGGAAPPPIELDLPDTALGLPGDEARLRLALGALIESASRYAPGERIGVRVERGEEPGLSGMPSCRVCVTTAGPGMPREDQQLVFGERWDAIAGVGRAAALGLFVARRIVELHGGRVSVEHVEEPAGTRFVVALPRRGRT